MLHAAIAATGTLRLLQNSDDFFFPFAISFSFSSSDDVSARTSAELTVVVFPSGSHAGWIMVTGAYEGSMTLTGEASVRSSNVGDVWDGSGKIFAGAWMVTDFFWGERDFWKDGLSGNGAKEAISSPTDLLKLLDRTRSD